FFFSSRRRHTRSYGDWSSDVCSSDLMRSPQGGDIPRPEGHPYLRLTRVLEEGFAVTLEPGLYFIPQLLDAARADVRRARCINWPRVEALSKFGGIRIEDDLAVTRDG